MNLTYTVLDQLGRSIVSGDFDEQGFPTEAQLARRLGVSHNITREVVKMLTAKGLLVSRPRHGTLVEPRRRWNLLDPDVLRWLADHRFSPELLLTFTEVRLAFEPQAAALAARRGGGEGATRIAGAIERMRAACEGFDDLADAATAFHIMVLDASHNPFFIQLRELVGTAIRISLRAPATAMSQIQAMGDYERVAEAIAAGDGSAAQAAMTAILSDIMARVSSVLPTETGDGLEPGRASVAADWMNSFGWNASPAEPASHP